MGVLTTVSMRFTRQTWMKQAQIRKDFELRSIRMRAMEMILFRDWLDKAKVRIMPVQILRRTHAC